MSTLGAKSSWISAAEPAYPRPAQAQVERELDNLDKIIHVSDWRIIPVVTDTLKPRENISWLNEKDFREWKSDLIEQWKTKPELVLPIAVFHKDRTLYILDGHHRWRSAKLAKKSPIWALQVRGRLVEPQYIEKQERWI